MKPYVVEDLRSGYVELVKLVRDEGQVVAPRGFKTWEIEDACFEVRNTRALLPYGTGRNIRPEIGAAEALLLCAGLASPSLITNVTDNFAMFLDGGITHGAYGPRVRSQLESVVTRLRSDRNSRQAIITIWDPVYDGFDGVRDLPCTLSFGFRLRNDALHMSVTMRSNDIWLGLAYDAFMFGQLGWTIANVLDVPFSSYRHHAYSLHLYKRNAESVEALREAPRTYYFEPAGFGRTSPKILPKYEETRQRIDDIYRGEKPPFMTRDEEWFYETLAPFERLTRKANFSS